MYNVVENVAGTFQHIAKADYVLAFCGTEMYVVKSRGAAFHEATNTPIPRKPDKVVAYYSWPEPRIAELRMRSEYKESWCRMGHAVGQRGCALCEEF